MSKIKVALVGSHGMGKTALVYELAARFKRDGVNVEIVKEVARSCPLPINNATTLDAQTWVLMQQIADEIQASHTADLVICDRAVLDNFAYLLRACGNENTEYVDRLDKWLDQWLLSYTALIRVPLITSILQPDGVRSTDIEFARDIDSTVGEWLNSMPGKVWSSHKPRVFTLGPDREQWRNEAYNIIKELL